MSDRTILKSLKGAWSRLSASGVKGRRAGKVATGNPDFFGILESRQLFANTALPTLAMLENPNNAVVRFETSLGDVDIELFSTQAPITTANFLNYVNGGKYDDTFFHRSAQQEPQGTTTAPGQARPSGTPFALQGGGFNVDADGDGVYRLAQITNDNPIVLENTGRTNVERTIAMARTNSRNSATGQFFFNMTTNAFLDPSVNSDGYAVFGRVIQGWDVVTAIHALTRYNLTNATFFAPPSGGVDNRSSMSEVPVQFLTRASDLGASNLIYVVNAEVIKTAGGNGYLEYQVAFSDGQRTASSIETLGLVNRNDGIAWYQVLARYEDGAREQIISSGVLNANASLNIPISDFNNGNLNLVRSGVPYSLVVQSSIAATVSSPRGVEAAFNRHDFGADTAEAGTASALHGFSAGAQAPYMQWTFPRIERNANSREFLSWVNLSSNPGTVSVQFYDASGAFGSAFNFDVNSYRRGGMEVHSMGLVEGTYSAVLTSTVPISASMSDFDIATTGPQVAGATPGWNVTGSPNYGAGDGVAADVLVPSGSIVSFLSVLNPTNVSGVITFNFTRSDGSIVTNGYNVGAGIRMDIDVASLGITAGEHIAARWTSPIAMHVQYTSIDTTARYQPGTVKADGASAMATSVVGTSAFIASAGLIDPARAGTSLFESVRVYNPFVAGASDGPFSVSLRFHFSDGVTIDSSPLSPAALGFATFNTHEISAVMTKINSGTEFRNYSISVIGTSDAGSIAGIAEYTRRDTQSGAWVSATASASGILWNLMDPRFRNG